MVCLVAQLKDDLYRYIFAILQENFKENSLPVISGKSCQNMCACIYIQYRIFFSTVRRINKLRQFCIYFLFMMNLIKQSLECCPFMSFDWEHYWFCRKYFKSIWRYGSCQEWRTQGFLCDRKEVYCFQLCLWYFFFFFFLDLDTMTLGSLNQSEPNFHTWLLSRIAQESSKTGIAGHM